MGTRKENANLPCSGPMPLGLASTEGLGHDFEPPSAGLKRRTAGLRFMARPAADLQAQALAEQGLVLAFIGSAPTI
jgi:hypothetical protein